MARIKKTDDAKKEKKLRKSDVKKELKEELKDEVKEELEEEILDGATIKPQRKVYFWEEVGSFLMIIVIIGLISLGGWYWYTHMKDHSKDEKKPETEEKEIVGYDYKLIKEAKNSKLLYNYLIVENDDNEITNVYDSKGKMVYEGQFSYTTFYVDKNHDLYLADEDYLEEENVITLYKLKDGEFEQQFKISRENVFYTCLLYRDGSDEYLLGFVGEKLSNESGKYEVEKTYIVNLDNEESELDGYFLTGDEARIGQDSPVVTHNTSYVTFSDYEMKNYGLYDLDNQEVVVDAEYELMYSTYDNGFVAKKDNKTGIINANQKILVVFEYDFIDIHEDFYVVGKDDKLAIMNDDYEFVTKFDFDYQRSFEGHEYLYTLCCTSFNSFAAEKHDDKYLLVTNYGSLSILDSKYKVNEAYIINSDGTYETIQEDFFDQTGEYTIFFNSKDKKYRVYDNDLEELSTIDLSSYTFGKKPQYFDSFGNYLIVSGKEIYFDALTGKEASTKDIVYELKNVKITYSKPTLKVFVDNEEVISVDDPSFITYIMKTDKGFIIRTPKGESIILIEK